MFLTVGQLIYLHTSLPLNFSPVHSSPSLTLYPLSLPSSLALSHCTELDTHQLAELAHSRSSPDVSCGCNGKDRYEYSDNYQDRPPRDKHFLCQYMAVQENVHIRSFIRQLVGWKVFVLARCPIVVVGFCFPC